MIIQPGLLKSEMILPTSKSVANRMLILAALANEQTTITNCPSSDDVVNLINCLKEVGLEIEQDQDKIIIHNAFPKCEKNNAILNIGEGGTTLHFLMSLLSLGSKEYKLLMDDSLKNRPHQDLIDALIMAGVKITWQDNEITIQGPIVSRDVTVESSLSSQYASSLKLVSQRAKLKLNIKNLKSSASFYELTEKIIKDFSIDNKVPVDMASLSYPLFYGLLNQTILFKNIEHIDYGQPDADVFKLFKDNIKKSSNGLKVTPLESREPIKVNLSNSLDMAPSLAFLCSYLDGVSVLSGLENLIYKESNRLDEIVKLLNIFGIKTSVQNHSLEIHGGTKISKQKVVVTSLDHRMVMTGFLFLKHNNGGSLANTHAINKSFSDFFKIM